MARAGPVRTPTTTTATTTAPHRPSPALISSRAPSGAAAVSQSKPAEGGFSSASVGGRGRGGAGLGRGGASRNNAAPARDRAPELDLLRAVRQDINEVKNIMPSNIEKVLDRGEKLELLTEQTESLSSQAFQFKKQAESLKTSRGFFSNFFGGASRPASVPQPNVQPSQPTLQRFSIVSEEAVNSGASLNEYGWLDSSSSQNVNNNNNNNFGLQAQQQYQQQQQQYQQQPYQQQGYYAPQSLSPGGPSGSSGASSGQLFVKTLTGWFLRLPIISDYI